MVQSLVVHDQPGPAGLPAEQDRAGRLAIGSKQPAEITVSVVGLDH